MRTLFRRQPALAYALIPIPYLAAETLLFAWTNAMERWLGWDGLLWQCTGALALTMFVLGPLCFIGTGAACAYHSVKRLRRREAVRKHAVLLLIGAVTVVLSVLFLRWYWLKTA